MRIAHVYKDYHPPVRGGIEQTVERMARAQAAAGNDVTVLVSASGGRRDVEETLAGVRVLRVAEWARAFSAPLCPGMPGAVRRQAADIWHLHYPNPTGELSWLLARPAGALVVTYHSDVVRQAWAMGVYGRFARQLLRRAAVIMPTSDAYLERSPWLRRERARCRVVPLGVDTTAFAHLDRDSAAARALRARWGDRVVLFVGALRAYKGLDVLLAAARDVRGRIVIVGRGREASALRAQHSRLALGDRVVFAGSVDDDALLAHLAAADVGVLPSTEPSEALGLSMIETMAGGIPVVCTALGTGTTFVNRDGETGLVVPPRDPRSLAIALNRLLDDGALRERLGAAARLRAQTVFSIASMMRGVSAAYEEALAGGAA